MEFSRVGGWEKQYQMTEVTDAQLFETFCMNVNDISHLLFTYAALSNVTFMVIEMSKPCRNRSMLTATGLTG